MSKDVWTSAMSIEYLGMSLILIVLGCIGNRIFLQSDFFVTDYDEWEEPGIGFNRSEWMWLLTATYFLPISICFHLIFVVQGFKQKWNPKLKLVIFYTLLILALFGLVQAYEMAYQVIDCGVLCVGDMPETADVNTGADVSVGLIYFAVLLPMIFIYVAIILSLHFTISGYSGGAGMSQHLVTSIDGSKSEAPISSSEASIHSAIHAKNSMDIGSHANTSTFSNNAPIYAVFLVFMPLMFFVTLSLPNNWQYLSLSGIRSYEQYSQDSDPPLLSEYGTCWTMKLSDHLVLKLYPDILIFYCFIYLFVVVGLLSQMWLPLQRFLYHRINGFGKIYVGECLAIFMMACLLVGEFCYWYYDHWYQNLANNTYSSEEIAARSMGQLANVVSGLLILPIARNSIWSQALGISWEGMVMYHTYMVGHFYLFRFVSSCI